MLSDAENGLLCTWVHVWGVCYCQSWPLWHRFHFSITPRLSVERLCIFDLFKWQQTNTSEAQPTNFFKAVSKWNIFLPTNSKIDSLEIHRHGEDIVCVCLLFLWAGCLNIFMEMLIISISWRLLSQDEPIKKYWQGARPFSLDYVFYMTVTL